MHGIQGSKCRIVRYEPNLLFLAERNRAICISMCFRFCATDPKTENLHPHKVGCAKSKTDRNGFGSIILHFFFLSFFVYLEISLFPSIFLVSFPLSLCMESTSYVLSFRMVFFLPCDHGLDFLHQFIM